MEKQVVLFQKTFKGLKPKNLAKELKKVSRRFKHSRIKEFIPRNWGDWVKYGEWYENMALAHDLDDTLDALPAVDWRTSKDGTEIWQYQAKELGVKWRGEKVEIAKRNDVYTVTVCGYPPKGWSIV